MVSARAIWGFLSVLTLMTGSACVQSNASRCSNGLVCPSGMSCSPAGGESCIDSDLVDACHVAPMGRPATSPACRPATCLGGICQASRCGDGRITGAEECDGAQARRQDLPDARVLRAGRPALRLGLQVRHLAVRRALRRRHQERDRGSATATISARRRASPRASTRQPGLACTATARSTPRRAGGGRCGDGIVNGLEQCDGAKFTTSCTKMGFAGALSALACSATCTFMETSCLCDPGKRCKPNTQQCVCAKIGDCGCVAIWTS